jgi:dihydrofolate reductase
MGKFRLDISISLDGFVAGPNQTLDEPLGKGGERLHEWVLPLEVWRRGQGLEGGEVNASTQVVEESHENVGAHIMGRKMFGGGPGPWGDEPWEGWWGDDPPFHTPVFVITNHTRPSLIKEGGTTFVFVTDGIESALEQARTAAADKDVFLSGGADVSRQYLAAGLVDEMQLHISPVLLGSGEGLWDGLADASTGFEQIRVVEGPGVAHLKYALKR